MPTSTSTSYPNPTDSLTKQLEVLHITEPHADEECRNQHCEIEPGIKVWTSSDVPHGSAIARLNNDELCIIRPGLSTITIACKRSHAWNASGLICPPGNLPITTSTSAYSHIQQCSPYQIENGFGKSVWNMCSDLDYYLAGSMKQDRWFGGSYLAVHVEKRLLEYFYTNERKFSDASDGGLVAEPTEPKDVRLYVDRRPCFDCLLFTAWFERKTNSRTYIYSNHMEYMGLHRHELYEVASRLEHMTEVSSETIDKIATVQRPFYGAARRDKYGNILFTDTNITIETWLQSFIRMKQERKDGKAQDRKLPGIPVGFVEDDDDE